jgi:hypothetical protein
MQWIAEGEMATALLMKSINFIDVGPANCSGPALQ